MALLIPSSAKQSDLMFFKGFVKVSSLGQGSYCCICLKNVCRIEWNSKTEQIMSRTESCEKKRCVAQNEMLFPDCSSVEDSTYVGAPDPTFMITDGHNKERS